MLTNTQLGILRTLMESSCDKPMSLLPQYDLANPTIWGEYAGLVMMGFVNDNNEGEHWITPTGVTALSSLTQ